MNCSIVRLLIIYFSMLGVKVVVFHATFNNILAISWCRKQEYLEKTNDLPQVIEKLYNITLNRVHLTIIRIRTHNISGDRDCLHSYAPRPSPEYSCGKRNPLYPIRATSFVSIVLYLIHI